MEALISYLVELRAENAATEDRRRQEEERDTKEKADIAATERTLTSWWERHRPGEPLPPEIAGPAVTPTHVHIINPDPSEGARQAMLMALDFVPNRFTTKEFFPLITGIQLGEIPESQAYDFLRKRVEEGKLWVYQQSAGRRPTTYSKEAVGPFTRASNDVAAILAEPVTNAIRAVSGAEITVGGHF